MLTFPKLIKTIREEAELTQEEFATLLAVSTILISMIETGQKEVSKKFLLRLAEVLKVHPASITPFLFIDEANPLKKQNSTEKQLIAFGERLQKTLIQKRAKELKKYAS